jgi:ribonuclease D
VTPDPVAPDPAAPDPAAPGPVTPTPVPPDPGGQPTGTESPLLTRPSDGLPPVTQTAAALAQVVEAFAAGTGPVALDTERAGGYRYSQRAYLVQARRLGAGTALVDPVACPDLSDLAAVLADAEWVLHAAGQDIPPLVEVGLVPASLFDTELAGRLLGRDRVGLGALVESELGVRLAKEHSAVDWSRRPIPEDWLAYAALDVELLLELREVLAAELREAGKASWAAQEFAALVEAPLPAPRHEPWRRTSGLHRVRGARRLALVRALWEERDRQARERDITPSRLLPDAAIVEAALAGPVSADDLASLPGFRGRGRRPRGRRELAVWAQVLAQASRLPERDLPAAAPSYDGPPPARAWAERNPLAASRLAAARAALVEIAAAHTLPVENLLTPDVLRRLLWEPPADVSVAAVGARLADLGARRWQVGLVAETLTTVLEETVPSLVTGE